MSSSLHQFVMLAAFVVVVLGGLVGIMKTVQGQAGEAAKILLTAAAGAAVLVIGPQTLGTVAVTAASKVADVMGLTPADGTTLAATHAHSATPSPAPTPKSPGTGKHPPAQSPTTTSAGDTTHVPWLPILGGAAGIVVLGAAGGTAVPAYRRRREALIAQRAEQAAQTAARERRFTNLTARHDKVNAAYTEFLLDIFSILERPALNDVTVTTTAAFLDAHADAADRRPDTCPADDKTLRAYGRAVNALDRAWAAADAHARRVGTGMLGRDERRKIDQAIHLLTTARNEGATDAERAAAYKKAISLLDGIIVLKPETHATLEIEAGKMRALTAAPAA